MGMKSRENEKASLIGIFLFSRHTGHLQVKYVFIYSERLKTKRFSGRKSSRSVVVIWRALNLIEEVVVSNLA